MKYFNAVFHGEQGHRFEEIDFIKSIAIIFVILLHTINHDKLFAIFAPFHIWHAVPIFMVIAGVNSTIYSVKNNNAFKLSNEYSAKKIKSYLNKIIVPFLFICIIQICILIYNKQATLKIFKSLLLNGGLGPGGYFTPIFIQHLIIFPLIIWALNRLYKYNHTIVALIFFCLSIFIEWLCVLLNVPCWMYKLLYVRYLFAVIIGSLLVYYKYRCHAILFLLLSLISAVYILSVSYLKWTNNIIYQAWDFQHAPAYFFTTLIVIILWNSCRFVNRKFVSILSCIGRSSYHIFLFQMIFFWKISHHVLDLVKNNMIWISLNLLICLSIGCLFFKTHEAVNRYVEKKFFDNSI